MIPSLRLRSIATALISLSLLGSVAHAGDYAVRDFKNKAHLYRFGPDMMDVLDQGTSFFMGVHVRQTSRPSTEPPVMLSLASSTVGNNRYLRLQTRKPTGEVEVQAYSRGSGGTDLKLFVDGPLQLGAWYVTGVWVAPSGGGWTFTVFKQKYGSSNLESVSDTTPTLPYPTLNIYTVARIAYVKETNGSIFSAHNFTGNAVAPVFIRNPSRAEIEAYMAKGDPKAIWPASRYLAAPDLQNVRDEVDGALWEIGGDSGDTSVVGTTVLGEPDVGGGGERPDPPEILP